METRRWAEMKSIFEGASVRRGAERDRFLEEHCAAGAALREEIESLLQAHESEAFLEESAPILAVRWMAEELAADEAPTSLGPWRIEKEIGRGGMSVVYLVERADGQFTKTAALKILGFGIFGDEVRRRFLRERQILANLDHPNIVRLLDGGVTADGRPWLVMDYVDGESLMAYVQRSAPSSADRLKLFLKICDGVSYAHQSSIVHCDLKPSNILVTQDGSPKLLDFGIAKVLQTERTPGTAPTQARFFTLEYASPEQVRGEPASRASDVYSLGLILFQLLRDRRPYDVTGLTTYEAVRIICEEPPDLEPLPAGLKIILGRALEKQPAHRYTDVNLLAADIQRFLEGGPITPYAASRRRSYGKRSLLAIGCVFVFLLVLALIAHGIAPRSQPLPAFEQITFDTGWTGDGAISRDGTLLAYTSDRGEQGTLAIWVQNLATKSRPVQLTSHATWDVTPDFAPDGKSIAFRCFRDGGGIYVIPVGGGVERKITNEGFDPRYSPDGAWIAYSAFGESGDSVLLVVPAAGGKPRRLGTNTTNAQYPLWTPDGRAVVFVAAGGNGEDYDWWAAAAPGDSSRPSIATRAGASEWLSKRGITMNSWLLPADWHGDQIVFTSEKFTRTDGTIIWKVPFSFERLRVIGPPEPVITSVSLVQHLRVGKGLSGKAVLLFNTVSRMAHLWGLPIDRRFGTRRGQLEQLTHDSSLWWGLDGTRARFSSDGRRLVFNSARSGNPDIWIRDMETSAESRVTSSADSDYRPVLSRSGAYVAYARGDGPHKSILISDLRNGSARRLCDDCGEPADWSIDDSRILCLRSGALWWLATATGQRTSVPVPPDYAVSECNMSPDGKWLAFVTATKTRKGLYGFIAPFHETFADLSLWIPVTEEPYQLALHWSASGNLLYYFHTADGFRCLYARRLDPATKRPTGPAVAIQHFHRNQTYPLNGSWISAGPEMLVMNLAERQANIWKATLPR